MSLTNEQINLLAKIADLKTTATIEAEDKKQIAGFIANCIQDPVLNAATRDYLRDHPHSENAINMMNIAFHARHWPAMNAQYEQLIANFSAVLKDQNLPQPNRHSLQENLNNLAGVWAIAKLQKDFQYLEQLDLVSQQPVLQAIHAKIQNCAALTQNFEKKVSTNYQSKPGLFGHDHRGHLFMLFKALNDKFVSQTAEQKPKL